MSLGYDHAEEWGNFGLGEASKRRREGFDYEDERQAVHRGHGESHQPLTVREQLERVKRAFDSPEPAQVHKGKTPPAMWLVLFLVAAAVVFARPWLWSGPVFWGVQRNWTDGSICYYADFAHKDPCLTTPAVSGPRAADSKPAKP
jgi:hypothetical protein